MKRSASKQPQYKILTIDPWLKPYYSDIALRMQRHADTRRALLGDKADLSSFANGYLYYGIARTDRRLGVPRVGAGRGRDAPHRRFQRLEPRKPPPDPSGKRQLGDRACPARTR